MKILITNLFLDKGTGTENFIYSLAKELKALGHEVHFFSVFNGYLQKKIISEGFICHSHKFLNNNLLIKSNDNFFIKIIKFIKIKLFLNYFFNLIFLKKINNEYDIVHFQHKSISKILYKQFKDTPKLYISHGVIPNEEQIPNKYLFPMDLYLCVSEEIKNKLLRRGIKKKNIKIIRNPIDTYYFNTSKEIRKKLKSILIISKSILKNEKYMKIIDEVGLELGLEIEKIGYPYKVVKKIKPYIEKVDLVFGLGRCAYEAMSMGRNIIVLDYLGLDGIIDSEKKFLELRKYNLSGRYYNNLNFTKKDLIKEIKKYKKENGILGRNLIEKYNNGKILSKKIEKYYKETINKCPKYQS